MPCWSASTPRTRSSRWTSSRVASRTTHSSCRRNNLRPVAAAPIRVLLVEDNKVFCEALELLLGLQQDIEVVASVGAGKHAVAASAEPPPDVAHRDDRPTRSDAASATLG